jgi:serine protease Do
MACSALRMELSVRTKIRVWLSARAPACAVLVGAVLMSAAQAQTNKPEDAPPAPAEAASGAAPSAAAQRLYEASRAKLMQIRTLLRGQDSQASVGSGFIVSGDGHVITNYHVVSQFALQPDRYRLVYSTSDGKEGPLELLAFDVIHDVALVRPATATAAAPAAAASAASAAAGAGHAQGLRGRGQLVFRAQSNPLARGERLYSLGNPLDVGFAVVEGNYNGLAERGFYPTIFFAGSLNPGMSGGPTLDDAGRVVGINVAARRDGEQVSFLVPALYAQALLERGRDAKPITKAVFAEITRQLMAHQELLTQRFLKQPWRSAGHKHYRIPVPQEEFMRCWGSDSPGDARGLQFERSDCEMDTAVFVSGRVLLGNLSVRHESYDGSKLGVLRFAQRYSESFRNESFGSRAGRRHVTSPQCQERYIEGEAKLPLRAVMCMVAYKKLPGLYDMSLLVATLDQSKSGVQGRFDVRGVSFDNALKLGAHYIEGFGWQQPTKTGLR